MPKTIPGLVTSFKGLWKRGHVNDTPPDHFSDSLNNSYNDYGVGSRDSTTPFLEQTGIVRTALYKPNPPFTSTNKPREIYLKNNGNLYDSKFPLVPIYTNPLMLDFGFVNFFGRCYISPSDGRIGLAGVNVKVYDGSGTARDAGGAIPSVGITAVLSGTAGLLQLGTYLISYAFETASGFITGPAAPFVAIDSFGGFSIDVTNLPLGPAGTVARWIIVSKAIPLRADLGIPFDVGTAQFYPLFFERRIGDNANTGPFNISFYDNNLVEEANAIFTQMSAIPAGVGLVDYKGRMISYGESADPSLVRGSDIGEPESFSSTSGFLITDPTDSSGVRSATEFRNTFYFFKEHRGYITQDNGLDLSTWEVVNFEKAVGTEQYGIAAVLDAKGSSSNGFIIASQGALDYFNGTILQPELSYKIIDLWDRINKAYFYKVQVAIDPINKRIYILVPLDGSQVVNYIIVGDFRDGLGAYTVKWDLWQFIYPPTSILIYSDFTGASSLLVTRIASLNKVVTLNIGVPGNDDFQAVTSFFELAPIRFSTGISQFSKVKLDAYGPCTLSFKAYGKDKKDFEVPESLTIESNLPGREEFVPFNLVSEQCIFRVEKSVVNELYGVNTIQVIGFPLYDERPA